MVEVVVLACLLTQPDRCEEFRIPFQDEMNVIQCVWESQLHAAHWSMEHPTWKLKRVTCTQPRA